ncbi:MAG: transporter permease [Acidimicrobiaceae bacterium]|nr:transporter permease [Acidimicrobiaceae bacterium]
MTTPEDGAIKVVPVRHYWQWVGVAVALVLLAMLVNTLFSRVPSGQYVCHAVHGVRQCHQTSEWRFSWNIVFHYFTTSEVLHGLWLTIFLTVVAMVLGISIGVGLAVMRLSSNRLLSVTAWTYTWFFRGTPVIVQLFFWENISILYHTITIGVPFTNITFLHINAVTLFTPTIAAIVALSLNEGAYMSEIARSGLIAVDEGQSEAAMSIGMTRSQTTRLVVLPQAMRVIIPPTGNEVISMLKTSSLASTIGVTEVFGATNNISANNFEIMPLLVVASLWYLIVTTVLSIGQFYLERRFARGALRTPPPTPLQRLRRDARGIASKFRTRRGVVGAAS